MALSTTTCPHKARFWKTAPLRPLDMDGPTSDFEASVIGDHSIFANFAAVAERLPNATAILVSDDAPLTFDAMAVRVRKLAALLVAETAPDDRIAILMATGPDYPITVMACIAAGRLFAPLDLRFPAVRNATVLIDFQPSCVVCAQDPAEICQTLPNAKIIDVRDVDAADVGGLDGLLPQPDLDRPAFVIFTSGSSGRPKGIVNSQHALLQRVSQQVVSVHAGPGDIFVCVTSPCTIAGMRELLAALLSGSALRMIDPETAGLRETRRLIGLDGTLLYCVPTLMRALCGSDSANVDFASLRVVRLGGEKVSWDDVARVRRVLGPQAFIQIGYSSTETTGTQRFVPSEEAAFGSGPSVGWILPGIDYAVVDEDGNNVADGEDGELVLRSRFVALGRWVDGRCDPAGYEPDVGGTRVFPTGDVGRIEAGGCLRVLGRRDRQIKINGRRVEPNEIEAALRLDDRVSDAVVIPMAVGSETQIVGFLVASSGLEADLVSTVRRSFSTVLPSTWCPPRLHVVPQLPRLPGGKLDVAALRALDAAFTAATLCEPDFVAPAHSLEATVARAWTATLGKRPSRIGFREAGGDSLSMLRLVFEIEEATGSKISLDRLQMDMNAAEMAATIADGAVKNPVDADDDRPSVLLFPGLTGDSPSLASFRADLEKHFRFVVADYPSWRMMVTTDCSLRMICDAAMAAVQTAIPEGVFRIAGYSLGGAVGYDIARRLREAGRIVDWIVVLDTDVEAVKNERNLRSLLRTLLTSVASLRRRDLALDRLACALAVWLTRPTNRRWLLRLIEAKIIEKTPAAFRFPLEMQLCELLQQQAFQGWLHESGTVRLPGPAYVIRSQEQRRTSDPRLGWSRFFEEVMVRDVSGDHRGMLRQPHRANLVEQFLSLVGPRSANLNPASQS
jgi:acyl-coenzyme A synthetase/AMP-(fatty) acid ligase/thioesterase domain-containing protein